jgi:dipeptidyl aminopeptidase/acylaminoacyl peptidase
VLWESDQTCGDFLPAVGAGGDVVAAVVHGYTSPPALAFITDGKAVPCLDLGHEGSAYLSSVAGTLEPVHWTAPDGQPVSGLLALPAGAGPYALVVHVHGGPVWAWRNEWTMHYPYTPLLVSRGYAVLHVNMRGSVGLGQEFIRAGLLDMGGVDATDFTSGVDALVNAGLVDPSRVGITGNSYGGFMAAWLAATTDRFAAVVARSPVTDWVSQHNASNLPGFDRRCLSGDPLDATSDYRTRSPLYLADQVRTPVMLMAGAQDLATPPEQAAMFHRALIERGRPSTLVIYPEEGHGVRHHPALVDQCARMLEFFERHMPAAGGDCAGE